MVTNDYMSEEHSDFLKQFKKSEKWTIFYEKYMASAVSFK